MQTKHTFLLTLVLGLVWAGLLFGFQNGPDPASNGVFGQAACNAAGCHVGNPLNASGGSLTLSGLPTEWTPGQSYPLTVTVQRTGAVKYGFQLSAVTDSTNQQAGTFTSTSSRVSVICGIGDRMVNCNTANAVQYAQHNAVATSVAPFTGTFTVNWRAPSSASAGTVRFNLAGNAANGNVQNTGDFIYTRVDRVAAAAPTTDNSVRAYTITNLGGSSSITDGAGDLSVGYSRIQPDSGNTTPSGVAVFGFRQNNVLVTEAGVPASPLIRQGRIYAEVNGPLNTGLAIANPNSQTAVISFHFTNAAGVDFGSGTFDIPANNQQSKFLDQPPFSGGSAVQGTLSFSSNVPVSVIALRTLVNEQGEFLITTLPVVDTSVSAGTGTQFIPHFAEGEGWTTQILLINPTDAAMTGTVQFFSQGSGSTTAGTAMNVSIGGQVNSSFAYSVPRRSSVKLATAGTAPALAVGSVRVVPMAAGAAPTPLVVFSYKPAGVTLSEAGVPAIQGSAFRMYVESSGTSGQAGNIQTGIAIANTSTSSGNVTLELTRLDGASTGLTATRTLPGSGQIVGFLSDFFSTLPNPFQGVLRISTSTSGISVVGLRSRYNENRSFLITTTPPTNEGSPASSTEFLFPHLVNGGGYTTQFVLFSGTAAQSSSGNLRFFKQDGSTLSLTLN